jgi:hypothetical protein
MAGELNLTIVTDCAARLGYVEERVSRSERGLKIEAEEARRKIRVLI